MSDPRRAAAVLLSAALATSLVVLPGSAATAATEADGSVDVTELDLVGVRSDLVSSLPDPEDVPLAEEAEPATASQDATVDDAGSTASSGEGGRVVRTALAATPTEDDEPRTSATDAEPTAPAAPSEPAASPSAAPRGAAPSPDVTAPSPSPSPTAGAGTTPTPDVLTAPLDTAPFTVLGLTWQDEPGLDDVVVRYRVREAGSWSEWVGVSASDIAPDLGTPDAEAGARDGTDAVVTAGADGLQVWAEAGSGRVTGLKAVLVDPGEATVDARATVGASTGAGRASDAAVRDAAVLAAAAPARPAIISRAGWGADESLRGCTPDYSNSMVSAAVHHTASANDYSADAVAGIIRGIYSYHTRPEAAGGRGWCDIGYNFLVDRFGRTFEGRAGGVTSTVVGVHTGGFNSRTIGVSAIGNFATTGAPDAMVEAISQLIAWKFSVHRITAGTNVTMVSGGGASRFPAGTVVSFPTIYAHRDAATTTCPGQYLYDRLAQIRARVAQLANAAVAASPRGVVDAYQGGSGITVRGWAFDPETDASLTIRVSVGGKVSDIAADRARPDVAAAYGVGSRHGFDARITAANGRHVVCVTAVNRGSGADVVLGCALVTVSNAAPVGVLDAISTTPTTISLRGWALDPDTTAPIGVHVYVDGKAARALTADRSRPDVGRAYGKGDAHGFDVTIPAEQGRRSVCLYLINQPTGPNPVLTCRTVQVGHPPIGSLDTIRTTPTSITVGGWALDPDTTAPIGVHVYVDGKAARALTADRSRPDVGRAYGKGDAHGFDVTIPAEQGRRSVCLYLINQPTGPNPVLTCRTVQVGHPPIGSLDTIRTTPTSITVGGWALDADTTAPIGVHVYVDGRLAGALTADRPRPDIARKFGLGDRHGFDATVSAAAGTRSVCLYLINRPTGPNPLLTCRSVSVR